MRSQCVRLAITAFVAGMLLSQSPGQEKTGSSTSASGIEMAELGSTERARSFGRNLLTSQPSERDLAQLKDDGIKTVISLRFAKELDWNEAAVVKESGLRWENVPFKEPSTLTDAVFEETLALLESVKHESYLLHCSSSNRTGAIWLAHRVLNDGLTVEDALEEAKEVGLSRPPHEEMALNFVKRALKGKRSVKPGINRNFLDPELDVSQWIARFEIESREVYLARERVLAALQLKPGIKIADIGAGTGFYTRLFSGEVGNEGWVYAVDISSRFLEHINNQSKSDNVNNVTSVRRIDRDVRLPTNSVDAVFICDTYHHFEYPELTLSSIHRALKPNGVLNLIDFERIPGKSRDFIPGHVRAGKEVFQQEILAAGFELIEEAEIPSFEENYFLRFRRIGSAKAEAVDKRRS